VGPMASCPLIQTKAGETPTFQGKMPVPHHCIISGRNVPAGVALFAHFGDFIGAAPVRDDGGTNDSVACNRGKSTTMRKFFPPPASFKTASVIPVFGRQDAPFGSVKFTTNWPLR